MKEESDPNLKFGLSPSTPPELILFNVDNPEEFEVWAKFSPSIPVERIEAAVKMLNPEDYLDD